MIKKIIALLLIAGLIISLLKRVFIWFLIIVAILFAIRLLADLFWWGKDNDKW
jgi:predicted membrane protein